MIIKIGCDLVEINKFKKSLERGGKKFLDKVFTSHELAASPKIESLAGIFSAKEAIIKALDLKAGDWKKIEIVKNKLSRPEANIESDARIVSRDMSISHDGGYVFVVAIFLIHNP